MTRPEAGAAKYDLAVAYRIYPRISKVPAVFANDKLKLAEACLESFKKALEPLKAKIWVILDDCPAEFERLFKGRFDANDLVLVKCPGIGNGATLERQLEILSGQTDSDLVYLAEDDYFYLPGALDAAVSFMRADPRADFVSLYDHPDYYARSVHRHENLVAFCVNRHWRTAAGACFTFLTTRENLRRTKNLFKTFKCKRVNHDLGIWMSLTKKGRGLFNPFLQAGDVPILKMIVKSWFYGWRWIIFGRKWRLWIPVPSLATHMESACLAPGFDWPALIKKKGG